MQNDAFVFLATNNACLGEHICPPGSRVCASDQCLRTGDNNLNLDDIKDFVYHAKGQIISGIIWDISKILGLTQTSGLLFKAIQYLIANAGYKEFILGLLLAEKELYESQYCSQFVEILTKRGFQELMSEHSISCESLK